MKRKTLSKVQLVHFGLFLASCFLPMFVYSSYKIWMYIGDADKVEDKYYNLFSSLHWMDSPVQTLLFVLICLCFALLVSYSVIILLKKEILPESISKLTDSKLIKTIAFVLVGAEVVLLATYMLCWKGLSTILTGINDYWLLDQDFYVKRYAFLPFLFLISALIFADVYHSVNNRLNSKALSKQKRMISLVFRGLGSLSAITGFIIHLTDHFTVSAVLYMVASVFIIVGRLIAGLCEEKAETIPEEQTISETSLQEESSTSVFSKETNEQTASSATLSNADELRKYKELLDEGIITQEEFEAKKKQLLGL